MNKMKVGDLLIYHTIESFRHDIVLNYDYDDDEVFIKLHDKTICVLVLEYLVQEKDVPINSCVCFVPSKNKNIIIPKKQLRNV